MAVDPDGDAIAIWLRSDGSRLRVQASHRPAGGVWSTAVNLSPAGEDAADPQLAIAANGDAVAVWETSTDRVRAASRPAGGDWVGEVVTLASGDAPSDPQVVLRPNGDAFAVWSQQVSANTRVQWAARSTDGTWATPENVSPSGQNATVPQVGIDAAGDAVAVWIRTDISNDPVLAATRSSGGSWSAAATLSGSGNNASAARVAVGPAGDAIAVWLRSDGDEEAVRAARRPAGGPWEASQTLSNDNEPATAPDVAVDAAGDGVAVWSRYDGSDDRIEARARPAAAGAWQASTQISASGQDAVTPQVEMTAGGDATAVWSRYDGARYVVQAARRAAGSWAGATPLSTAGQAGVLPQIAFDDAGNAAAAWIRSDGTATVQAAGYDAAGPVAGAVSVPPSGTTGSPVSVSVTFTDVWSALAGTPSWIFGDGGVASGASAAHTYAAAGVNAVTVSQSDALGNPGQATRSITVGDAPPIPPTTPPATPPLLVPEPPAPDPQPVLGKSVVAEPLSGTVLARVPGSARYAPVDPSSPLPVGTILDTRRGRVAVATALTPSTTQTGVFWAGVFQVRQPAKARGRTDIVLRGGPPRCSAGEGQVTSARRRPARRRLWAQDDDGRFTTGGRNSVASVRGTKWLTEERCDGTLTRVVTGAVLVRNLHTGRSVLVTAGRSHLARIPRLGG